LGCLWSFMELGEPTLAGWASWARTFHEPFRNAHQTKCWKFFLALDLKFWVEIVLEFGFRSFLIPVYTWIWSLFCNQSSRNCNICI
jgi:hypothetical protein